MTARIWAVTSAIMALGVPLAQAQPTTSSWKVQVTKDPITDIVVTGASTSNAAGQRLTILCKSKEPSLAAIFLDQRITGNGDVFDHALIRVGEKKAFQATVIPSKGALTVAADLSGQMDKGSLPMMASHASVILFLSELAIVKTNTVLARYESGGETINFAFDTTGALAAEEKVRLACGGQPLKGTAK